MSILIKQWKNCLMLFPTDDSKDIRKVWRTMEQNQRSH